MKKLIFLFLIAFMCIMTFALLSCGGDDVTTTADPDLYNVTYELNGGTNNANNPATYNKGDIITLNFPTKEDYMFAGWFTDSALTNEIKEIMGREENLTLYAKWVPYEEVIEFFINDDGEYHIKRFYKNVKTLIIPSSYKGTSISQIEFADFNNCKILEEIFISSSITSILYENGGPYTGCTSLKRIVVEEGNPSYKSVDGVLYSKDGKKLIWYPSAKTDETYDIPQGTEVIGKCAFIENPYITNINIPSSVKEINGIYRCTALKSLKIPDGATKLSGLSSCTALESLEIPDSVTEIESFYGCSSLKSITLPSNIEFIGEYAFYQTSLESIVIPSGVKSIGNFAFYDCQSLKSIVIPESVTHMSSVSIYEGCSSSLTVYCEAESKPESWDENWDQYVDTVVWGHKESKK